MLIYRDRYVYRFESLSQAKDYAINNCRGSFEFYVIVDTEEDTVVESWSY